LKRVAAIDFVRGALMVMIICAHATLVMAPEHHRAWIATRYLLSGTVGFTTVSGLLVGWFAVTKRDRYDRVARRYLVQALRLVFIAHPLMALALFLPNDQPLVDQAARTLFITDTLAVLFVLVVPLVPHTAPRVRLAAGLAMLLADAVLDLYTPPGPATRLVHEILCGVDPHEVSPILLSNYGLLSLGGMFLIGTRIGELYASVREGETEAFAASLARAAAILTAVGGVLVGGWMLARHVGNAELAHFLYPDYETTLYPIYLGFTLLVFSHALGWQLDGPVARAVILLGRTSLFVYVAQYFLVETAPTLLGWRNQLSPIAWAAVCVPSVALLIPAAAVWNRYVKHAG
jgi:hypothetical protein